MNIRLPTWKFLSNMRSISSEKMRSDKKPFSLVGYSSLGTSTRYTSIFFWIRYTLSPTAWSADTKLQNRSSFSCFSISRSYTNSSTRCQPKRKTKTPSAENVKSDANRVLALEEAMVKEIKIEEVSTGGTKPPLHQVHLLPLNYPGKDHLLNRRRGPRNLQLCRVRRHHR